MKTNSRIRLTQRLAVLTGIIGLGAFLSLPVMAKPVVKGAGSAGMAHPKQDASPTTAPGTDTAPTTAPGTGTTPNTAPGTGTGTTPTTAPSPRSAPTTPPRTRTSPTTSPGTGSTSQNIVQVASGNSAFSTLVQAVTAAGLANTLSAKGPFTVFAPTDQAFAALPAGTLQLLLRPENKNLLRRLLTYHVVPGRLAASDIRTGTLKALGGGLAVEVQGNKVIVNDASVTQADVPASNGVIHAIDRVLMPRQLRQTILSKLKAR